MLAATAQVHGLSVNVRIRNISECGALIEGDLVPEPGTELKLQRGCHEALGVVMWAQPGRYGVKFRSPIVVARWAGVQTAPAAPTGFGSAEREPPPPAPLLAKASPPDRCEALLTRRIGEELGYVQRLIDNIANELAGNPVIVHRHGHTLQGFDLASQILGHLSRILAAEDGLAAAQKVGMQELKKRLLRS